MSVSTQTNSEVPSIPLYKLKEVQNLSEAEGRRVFIELTDDEIYPSSHEDDVGETSQHYKLINGLMQSLMLFLQNRPDVFVSANLNLYYDRDNPQAYKTPDILIAFGVSNEERRVYKLWREMIFPQVIFEFASERTWREDISEKREIYEKLGAEEYYLIDTENYLPLPLMAYQREDGKLQNLYLKEDRIFSPRLKLEIVHAGAEVKLFDPERQEFLRTLREAENEIEQLKAELAKLKGEN